MNSKTLVKPHSFQRTQLQEKIEGYEKGENKVNRNWNKLSGKKFVRFDRMLVYRKIRETVLIHMQLGQKSQVVLVHTFHPSNWEAEAG